MLNIIYTKKGHHVFEEKSAPLLLLVFQPRAANVTFTCNIEQTVIKFFMKYEL